MYFGAKQGLAIRVNGLFFSVFQSSTARYGGIKGHQKAGTAGRQADRKPVGQKQSLWKQNIIINYVKARQSLHSNQKRRLLLQEGRTPKYGLEVMEQDLLLTGAGRQSHRRQRQRRQRQRRQERQRMQAKTEKAKKID